MKKAWVNFCKFIATGFGVGFLPYAPGTWGTLLAVPLYILIMKFIPSSYYFIIIIGLLIGILVCDVATKSFGVQDDSRIVWDEIIGFWLTMILVPPIPLMILLGFIFFRIFDVIKPWPISMVDKRIHGGFGVMLDDVLAGLAAGIVLYGGYQVLILRGVI